MALPFRFRSALFSNWPFAHTLFVDVLTPRRNSAFRPRIAPQKRRSSKLRCRDHALSVGGFYRLQSKLSFAIRFTCRINRLYIWLPTCLTSTESKGGLTSKGRLEGRYRIVYAKFCMSSSSCSCHDSSSRFLRQQTNRISSNWYLGQLVT